MRGERESNHGPDGRGEPSSVDDVRVTFLGHACSASQAALAALLAAGVSVSAVVLAGAPTPQQDKVERLAATAGAPVVWVQSTAQAVPALQAFLPGAGVAACFPWRLPRAAREAPRLGILNIHPSLLPTGRGPEPVFWTLRRGERVTGVTVHQMDAGFDTGPIVVQETLPVPDGIRAGDLEDQLMAVGARALSASLPGLASGKVQPRPQPAAGGTLAPLPTPEDWAISPLLPAAWAWRFVRGVALLSGPLRVVTSERVIPVADALAWSAAERPDAALIDGGDGTVRVRFSPGWVRFLLR